MFHYQKGSLYCEDTHLVDIATQIGTPTFIYSRAELHRRAQAYQPQMAKHLVCYAVKANGNPILLKELAQVGLGADVTSGGELFLAQHAGFTPDKIIFSGVGKMANEIEQALQAKIRALHVESAMELELIGTIAEHLQQVANIGVRVNPNIQASTHPYISTGTHAHKFGVTRDLAMHLLHQANTHPWLNPVGLATHIGSQINQIPPFTTSAQLLVTMAQELTQQGIQLCYLDIGGGLAINYTRQSQDRGPSIAEWTTAVTEPIINAGYEVVMEPGRSIMGPTGILLMQVLYTKTQDKKQFVITNAGMNDLLRPTLYGAYHTVLPVTPTNHTPQSVDIVGPICETGDWLAQERLLPPVSPGNYLAILHTGAYGFAMSSNYNGRLKAAEVLVNGAQFQLIRQRQQYNHLLDGCPMEKSL